MKFSDEELEVIVEEAERQNRVVAAHVHGKAGIMAAIRAGCRTVEHVSYADKESLTLMKEKGILYVATRGIVDALYQEGGKGITPESWEKLQQIYSAHWDAYKLAIKSGVKIALGTDFGGNPGQSLALGKNAIELEFAVRAGMTPAEAVKAATAMGPVSVGPQAPKTGQLKVGYEADVIAVQQSPLRDVKILQTVENITHVWKGGKLFKGPRVGPWGEE